MVPLQVFKASPLSSQQRQWRIINPGALSPWNVMTWGMKQLRGFVVGSDTPETSARLQVQELVLVENLKVWLSRSFIELVLIESYRRQQIG